jgi:hypothetical protein
MFNSFRAYRNAPRGIVLDRARKKLREAEFFLGCLIAESSRSANGEPEAADFYLSAFFASARSVLFILQKENLGEYGQWSRDWIARLAPQDADLLDFCVDQQNNAGKVHAADTGGTFTTGSLVEFMQDVRRRGGNLFIADGMVGATRPTITKFKGGFADRLNASVDASCRIYLGILKRLVAEFERDHPSV